MIVLTLAVYYGLAVALIGGAVLLALYQNKRERAAADARRQSNSHVSRLAPDDEPAPDLSDAALQPIAPLLLRVAREYRDKPAARERLVRSLTEALDAPAPAAG